MSKLLHYRISHEYPSIEELIEFYYESSCSGLVSTGKIIDHLTLLENELENIKEDERKIGYRHHKIIEGE